MVVTGEVGAWYYYLDIKQKEECKEGESHQDEGLKFHSHEVENHFVDVASFSRSVDISCCLSLSARNRETQIPAGGIRKTRHNPTKAEESHLHS